MLGAAASGARRLVALVLASTMGFVAAACSNSEARAVKTDGELVIGANLELTGPESPAGIAAENALRITLDRVNSSGVTIKGQSYRVRLVVRDNKSDPDTATRLTNSLVNDEKVIAVIGGSAVDTAAAIAKVAEAKRVPLLSLAPENDLVRPAAAHRFVFKLPANAEDVARLLAKRLHADARRRTAVLAITGPYGEEGVRTLASALAGVAVPTVGTVRFPAPDRRTSISVADSFLDSAVRQVLAAKPDAVVVWSVVPAAGQAAKALRAAGFTGQILFDSGAGGDDTLSADYRAAVENSLMAHPAVFDVDQLVGNNPSGIALQRFYYRYTQLHGTFTGLAPYASDALNLVIAAAGNSATPTPGHLRDALEKTTYDGIAGTYLFSPANHGGLAGDGLVIFRCVHGQWVRVQ